MLSDGLDRDAKTLRDLAVCKSPHESAQDADLARRQVSESWSGRGPLDEKADRRRVARAAASVMRLDLLSLQRGKKSVASR
jgi:hypothetical protein